MRANLGWGTWQGALWLSLGAPIAVGNLCWVPCLAGLPTCLGFPPLNLLALPVTKHEAFLCSSLLNPRLSVHPSQPSFRTAISFLLFNIYLTVSGLNCGTRDLCCGTRHLPSWHAGFSLVVERRLSCCPVARGILATRD